MQYQTRNRLHTLALHIVKSHPVGYQYQSSVSHALPKLRLVHWLFKGGRESLRTKKLVLVSPQPPPPYPPLSPPPASSMLISTLCLVHRLFDGRRETLWAEKLGLVPRFAGNAATQWGTNREALALGRYVLSMPWQH